MYLYVPVIKNGKKLHSPWQGLHVVVKKIGDMTFQVEEVGNHRKRKVVNFNRLKLCGVPPSANQYPVPLSAYWSLLQFTSAETASSPLVHIGWDWSDVYRWDCGRGEQRYSRNWGRDRWRSSAHSLRRDRWRSTRRSSRTSRWSYISICPGQFEFVVFQMVLLSTRAKNLFLILCCHFRWMGGLY